MGTFYLFQFNFGSLILYFTGRGQSIIVRSIVDVWDMPQTLRRVAVSELLLLVCKIRLVIYYVGRSKSLSVSTVLYYVSIYLLYFMILCKLGRWILLINTLSLIDLIKIIQLEIIFLLRFDQCWKLIIYSFYTHRSIIHRYFIIMHNSFRDRRIELY